MYRTIIAITLLAPTTAAAQVDRRVAITVDDLPKVGGDTDIASATAVTHRFLDAFRRYDVEAVGFVTAERALELGDVDERVALLDAWVEAGHELGNHTYSHPGFHNTPLHLYQDDAVQGDRLPRTIMARHGDSLRYFRHPFNSTGPDADAKAAFAAFAARRGWIVTPFTVEPADYVFETIYTHAETTGDSALRDSIVAAYRAFVGTVFDFAESLSRQTFGREIAQVYLIHVNEINAAQMEWMLAALRARGYRFVTLDEAMRDPAYAAEDGYVGRWGWSWLHRWRLGMGLDAGVRESPDPPAWVLERYQSLTAR